MSPTTRPARHCLRRSVPLARWALLVLPALGGPPLAAQPYVEDGGTRHSFAQFLVGADLMAVPSGGRTFALDPSGAGPSRLFEAEVPTAVVPRLNLAGTHFWGHASFYVSIPVGRLGDGAVRGAGESVEVDFSPGVETGFRLYPWRIESGAVRPFVGAAYAQSDFEQTTSVGSGVDQQKSRIPLQAGLTWQRGSTLVEVGVGRFLGNEFDYFVDRSRVTTVRLPSTYMWVGVNRQFDSTIGLSRDWEEGTTAELTRRAAEAGALSGFSLAIGPSAAFLTGSAPRNASLYPALGAHRTVPVFPDIGVGYYHHPRDVHLNLAFRANESERSAFGQTQRLGRTSLAFEAFRFLFDYKGFAPFVGPVVSREWLSLDERVDGVSVAQVRDERWRAGVVFGWDIRPDDLRGFLLRTNLRYTPVGRIGEAGGVGVNQLEFNFIQFVWYPGRTSRIARALGLG